GGAHERHWPGGGSAASEALLRRAQAGEGDARARAAFENDPLLAGPVEDRIPPVLDREEEAPPALRRRLHPPVEPDRAVEGGFLLEEEVGELVGERVAVIRGGEVALRLAPFGERADHPADQLAHAPLTRRRAERTTEVLRHHDIGRELRPRLRHLNVA